jgi:hypothetical protein
VAQNAAAAEAIAWVLHFRGQLGAFRSKDLLRTENGKFDSGLSISVLVLTNNDPSFLSTIGINLSGPIFCTILLFRMLARRTVFCPLISATAIQI